MSAYILLIPLNYIFSRNFENNKEQFAVTSSQIVGAYSKLIELFRNFYSFFSELDFKRREERREGFVVGHVTFKQRIRQSNICVNIFV